MGLTLNSRQSSEPEGRRLPGGYMPDVMRSASAVAMRLYAGGSESLEATARRLHAGTKVERGFDKESRHNCDYDG